MVCKVRFGYRDLERLYSGHIGNNSIICTDSHKSYIQFVRKLNLDHNVL